MCNRHYIAVQQMPYPDKYTSRKQHASLSPYNPTNPFPSVPMLLNSSPTLHPGSTTTPMSSATPRPSSRRCTRRNARVLSGNCARTTVSWPVSRRASKRQRTKGTGRECAESRAVFRSRGPRRRRWSGRSRGPRREQASERSRFSASACCGSYASGLVQQISTPLHSLIEKLQPRASCISTDGPTHRYID